LWISSFLIIALEARMGLDRWEVVRELGRGGQGTVLLVRDGGKVASREELRVKLRTLLQDATSSMDYNESRRESLNQLIDLIPTIVQRDDPKNFAAMKQLHAPEDARNAESAAARIASEMKAMSRFEHPHVLKILDHDEKDKRWYVSEYHPEGTLEQRQNMFSGNPVAALRAMRPIVAAVAELHKAQIVHRDIKPANIFCAADGRLVLGDFGLAFFTDETHTRVSETLENVGSRDWMPPWAHNTRIDDVKPTFDVFSLGKVLWWMVTGYPVQRLPFWLLEKADVSKLHSGAPFISLVNPILKKCVVQEEDDCLANAWKLLGEIDAALDLIDNDADPIGPNSARRCKVCGVGYYRNVSDFNMLRSTGVDPSGSRKARVERCDRCGNIQTFLASQEDLSSAVFKWWDG
jgi:serine/threonine protein kinase